MPQYSMHFLNAFLIVLVLIPPSQLLAEWVGLVDVPHGRKMHESAIPLTGGIAMFIAFALPLLSLDLPQLDFLLLGLSVLVAVGVVDDLVELGPWSKLGAQFIAALILILPGMTIVGPEGLIGGGVYPPGDFAIAFSVLLIVGVMNAFNMMDGIDGLAGGAAATSLTGLTVAAAFAGQVETEIGCLLLLFAVLGFLAFNMRHRWRSRACVFMGDAGSLMLGGAIAFFVVKLAAGGTDVPVPLPVLLWLVAVPVFDMTILVVQRLVQGQSPMVGDRRHLHHLLLRAGKSPQAAAAILVLASGVLSGVGLLGWMLNIPPAGMLLGLAVPFSAHLYFVCVGWKRLARAGADRRGPTIADSIGSFEDQAV